MEERRRRRRLDVDCERAYRRRHRPWWRSRPLSAVEVDRLRRRGAAYDDDAVEGTAEGNAHAEVPQNEAEDVNDGRGEGLER